MLQITLDCLVVLDTIARHGSFAAAAAQLNRVPSAVSYSVQKLEQDLGVQLFDRTGHRAKLTPAGAEVLAHGRGLVDAAGALERRIRRLAGGAETTLRIAVGDLLPAHAVYPHLAAYYADADGAPATVEVASDVGADLWALLADEQADLLVGAVGEGPDDDRFVTRRIGSIAMALVVPPGHPLLARSEAPPAGAAFADDVAPRLVLTAAEVQRAPAGAPVPSRDVLVVPNFARKCDAIRHGLGVGHVPECLAAEDLRAGRLHRVVGAAPQTVDLAVAWRDDQAGQALAWFTRRFRDAAVRARLLAPPDGAEATGAPWAAPGGAHGHAVALVGTRGGPRPATAAPRPPRPSLQQASWTA